MNPLFANLETSVFEVMSRLARETGAVNLGQGFPDDPGPADVREAAARAVVEGWNQYPPMMGLPELRHAIAAHYARWQGGPLAGRRARPRGRGDGDLRRDRGDRRRAARADRARRRGRAVRADVRRIPAARPPRPRRDALRGAEAASVRAIGENAFARKRT